MANYKFSDLEEEVYSLDDAKKHMRQLVAKRSEKLFDRMRDLNSVK